MVFYIRTGTGDIRAAAVQLNLSNRLYWFKESIHDRLNQDSARDKYSYIAPVQLCQTTNTLDALISFHFVRPKQVHKQGCLLQRVEMSTKLTTPFIGCWSNILLSKVLLYRSLSLSLSLSFSLHVYDHRTLNLDWFNVHNWQWKKDRIHRVTYTMSKKLHGTLWE